LTTSFAAFFWRRLLGAVAFVIVVSASTIVLTRLAPGDATTDLVLTGAGQSAILQERARLGLDRPVYVQLGRWISGLAQLDLGTSSAFRRPVSDLVRERAAKTAELAAVALFVATIVGLPLGLLTGSQPRGWLTRIVTPLSIALVSCPPIVGALALSVVAASTGWLSLAPGRLALPSLALALPLAAMLERLQAQATSEALSAPDLVAAAARGVPRARLLWVHAARQSLRPVLGVYGVVIGSLFSGSLAVEFVTAWPGLGRLMYDALVGRDLFLVAGCALIGAIFLAAGNLAADLMRGLIDPRVRERLS
jgi:peptide/nickel transport system permease protein